jgi:hypothetical protein
MGKILFTKSEAVAYLQKLLEKEWFKNRSSSSYSVVEKLLLDKKTSSLRLRTCAIYWFNTEHLRKNLGESIE